MEAMQLNAKECHTIDVGLVAVDRGESRLLERSRGWSRRCKVCGGGDRRHLRKRVCRTQRCRHDVNVVYDDLNGGELVWLLALVVTEDERNGAMLELGYGCSRWC